MELSINAGYVDGLKLVLVTVNIALHPGVFQGIAIYFIPWESGS